MYLGTLSWCLSAFMSPDSAVEGVSSSSSTKDVGSSSPLTDRKKHRRKKSMNQKGDAASGQADGKHGLYLLFSKKLLDMNYSIKSVTFYHDFLSSPPPSHSQTQNVED